MTNTHSTNLMLSLIYGLICAHIGSALLTSAAYDSEDPSSLFKSSSAEEGEEISWAPSSLANRLYPVDEDSATFTLGIVSPVLSRQSGNAYGASIFLRMTYRGRLLLKIAQYATYPSGLWRVVSACLPRLIRESSANIGCTRRAQVT
ncbi:hypothetical protein B0H11DRAFT_483488 [Mycena galericulata]|nr:hypothetical protein B0H11DRAFT_483488 [Mycena galericulata]